ncbi:hypothetical protein ACQ4OD_06960 [Pseudomonas sp. WC1]|uniref:hypothetical protein n=1 Tax=Pseudomonas TaxID=286 RepID=UPI0020231239|nr:hypothetical protein [Pseudomonas mosselii]MCL8337693.1 hypothetical protein [Pseudomonas mosselii]
MTSVQWKTLPTKANQAMERAGADAAREYLERTGCNSLFAIYEAMTAAAPEAPAAQQPGEAIAWLVGSAIWWSKAAAERDSSETGEPVIPLCPCASPT